MQLDTKRITNTSGFLSMAKAGQKMGYNRQADLEALTPVIDAKGIHVENFMMLHEHRQGACCEPHYRSVWMVKITGEKFPVTVTIDTTPEAYEMNTTTADKLPTQEEILDQQIMEKLQNA